MPEEKQDVNQKSSPELEQALEGTPPSAEQQTQETQTPPAEEGVTQEQEQQPEEEQRIPYSRFKEKVDEANWYKQQLERQMQPQPQPQFQQPQPQDPYAGMTPEEKVFWQNVDQRAKQEARRIVEQEVKPVLEAGRQQMVQMTVHQFRQMYPDVKPNSPEELGIAEKIQQGYPIHDAYKIVMFEKVRQQTESKVRQQVKQTTEAKRKANVETKSLPSKTALPTGKLSDREAIEKAFDNLTPEEKADLGF
jgi:hypothetical protein